MILNYFKIAFRGFYKNRGYTLINVSGLALGMAMAMLIFLWVWDEWNFNKNAGNYERVGRVMRHAAQHGDTVSSPNMPFPLAAALRENYKADFEHVAVSWDTEDYTIAWRDHKFKKKGRFIEPGGAKILALQMVDGDAATLEDPTKILIAASAAASVFGKTNPVGQTVKIDNELEAMVAGVYKDFPHNSDYNNLSFVAPWKLFTSIKRRQWINQLADNWEIKTFEILVQTTKNTAIEAASAKVRNELNLHSKKENKATVSLHPMRKWHLYSSWENGINTGGQIYYLKLFTGIAIFILLLACINFMNLSTARSGQRAREVGVRKAVGSRRIQLIFQFFTESFLVVTFSFLAALVIVLLALPQFNAITGKQIELSGPDGISNGILTGIVFNPYFLLTCAGFCLLVSFLAGAYPAFYLSSFKPISVLKSSLNHSSIHSLTPRRVLVILQFTISISLIVGTVGVFRQIQFGLSRNIGYDKSHLINVKVPPGSARLDALKNDLLQSGVVTSVAQSSGPVTDILSNARGFAWGGKTADNQDEFAVIAASHTYGKTVGWQVVAGRDFSEAFLADSSAIIINQAAAKYMGLDNPVGKKVRWKDGTFNDAEYHIVGVVQDMIMQSPYEPVKQTIYLMTYAPNYLYIKLNPNAQMGKALAKVRAQFDEHIPGAIVDLQFAGEQYDSKFNAENRIGKLTFLFAAIAVFISCLGVFGLAAFTAEQRRSEIGIRKVLGASVASIWKLITIEFAYLTVIAIVIAIPVSYYFLAEMLARYQYRSSIPWWIFGASGLAALIVTILTVSYQAIRAALSDPVKALRSE